MTFISLPRLNRPLSPLLCRAICGAACTPIFPFDGGGGRFIDPAVHRRITKAGSSGRAPGAIAVLSIYSKGSRKRQEASYRGKISLSHVHRARRAPGAAVNQEAFNLRRSCNWRPRRRRRLGFKPPGNNQTGDTGGSAIRGVHARGFRCAPRCARLGSARR